MRDFVGYANEPPVVRWPKNARVVLQFALNYEEGSEANILDGDGRTETGLAEVPGGRMPPGVRDLAFESLYEYGSRVGIWRIFDLFKQRGLPLTLFGCALALERNPKVAEFVAKQGYDVCCHGWRWVEPFRLSESEEREHIERAVQSILKLTGERPRGWYCRYGAGVNTRRLLVQEGGFLYDSDAYNDELPYWVDVIGKQHLIVPYTMDANDGKFASPSGFSTGTDFFDYLKNTFDQFYEEGSTCPRIMSVGLHARMSGKPARARSLAKFLDYVLQHDLVWIARRLDIAEYWRENFPPIARPMSETSPYPS